MEFELITIGKLIDNNEVEIKTGPFGTQLKASDYVASGTPVINVRNIGHGTVNEEKLAYISNDTRDRLKDHIIEENDIVFGRKGAVDRHAFIKGKYHKWFQGSDCIRMRIVSNRLYPRFISYYFLTHEHKSNIIQECSHGTIMASLNQSILRLMKVPVVSFTEQKAIADTLSCLDDKIELNNRINKTLEEMAQAIFKSWFVDFEPFQDGEFEDSELGPIPKGWRVGTLDEVTSKFTTGLNPRKNFVLGKGTNYYVTIKNLSDNQIWLDDRCDKITDEAISKINKRSDLKKGDLLFSGIGTIGRVYLLDVTPINWNVSESIFTLRPNNLLSSEVLYMILLSDDLQGYARQLASGSVQKGIRMGDLKKYLFPIPVPEVVEKITALLKPLISTVKLNQAQNRTLSAIRDTLLPKLMSGEIRVPIEEVQ